MHQANPFCTTSGLGFGSSLGFHADSHEFDSRSLRCILSVEDSVPDIDHPGTVAWNLWGVGGGVAGYNELRGI